MLIQFLNFLVARAAILFKILCSKSKETVIIYELLLYVSFSALENKKAQLKLTNPRDAV